MFYYKQRIQPLHLPQAPTVLQFFSTELTLTSSFHVHRLDVEHNLVQNDGIANAAFPSAVAQTLGVLFSNMLDRLKSRITFLGTDGAVGGGWTITSARNANVVVEVATIPILTTAQFAMKVIRNLIRFYSII